MNRSEGQWVQQELSFPVTRGIKTNKVNTEALGSHWSTEPRIAHDFQRKSYGHFPFQGTARINAEIPMGSVETDTNVLRSKRVGREFTQHLEGGYADEKEVTARSGAPIKVHSITTVGPKKRTRANKALEKATDDVSTIVDYQDPGDSELLDKGYKTFHRSRTRTYNPPREMKA